MYNAGNIKYNYTCTACFASFPKRARTIVIQVGNHDHFAATASEGVSTTSHCSRECREVGLWQIIWTGCPVTYRVCLLASFSIMGNAFAQAMSDKAVRLLFPFPSQATHTVGNGWILGFYCLHGLQTTNAKSVIKMVFFIGE